MGWCSGTDVFDPVAKQIIIHPTLSRGEKVDLLVVLIESLEDHDWDCQSDSDYYDNDLVVTAMKIVHPDWAFEGDED